MVTYMLLLVVWVFQIDATKLRSHGFWVLTSKRGMRAPWRDGLLKPIVLRIDEKGHWFFKGKPVSTSEFAIALRETFRSRPEWLVYIDAHPDLDFGKVELAVDVIEGLHAKAILVTPGVRSECCEVAK